MQVVVPILLAATVFAVINWTKQITSRDWNSIITQLLVWVVGCVLVWLAAQTVQFGNWAPFGVPLKLLKTADLLFIGLNIGSGGTAFNEYRKARDNTDTSTTPPLIPSLSYPRPETPTVATRVPPTGRTRVLKESTPRERPLTKR